MKTESRATQKAGRCLLISANRATLPYPVYPLGIAYLLGALREQGHQADHLDILASGGYQPLQQLLQERQYDLIGISIRNIDTVDSADSRTLLDDVTAVIAIVREETRAPIVLGGPGFSIMPEMLLDHCRADYGIVGEGETALPSLLQRLLAEDRPKHRLLSMPATVFPSCRPVYTAEATPYYLKHGGMLNVQSKRGCGYNCAYCSYPSIEGRALRHRDPAAIIQEINDLQGMGARYLFFTDAIFNDPQQRYLQLAEALIRAGNRTPWCAFFRPQHLDRAILRLLKKSGLAAMELGTDAASDATLAGLNKGFTFAEVARVHEAIVAEDIPSAHFVMFAGPGETAETVEEGLANLERLQRTVVFTYIGIRILPGTAIHQLALQQGQVTASTDLLLPRFYYSPAIVRDDVETTIRYAYKGRRDRVFPVMESERLIPLLHRLGHIGPLWEKLIVTQ
jgi:lipid biosynthesis B12-binding/radical SAM protein